MKVLYAKCSFEINNSRLFPVNNYSLNICTCKCNVSWLCRNANFPTYREKKEAHTFRLSTDSTNIEASFFCFYFLLCSKGNPVQFTGLLSFAQPPIATAPVFPSSPSRPGNRLENAILKDVSIAKAHLDEKVATDGCRRTAPRQTGGSRFF